MGTIRTGKYARRRGRRTGFSLVEALLTLAILAILMTALGTAVHSTMESYRENERLATFSQVARAVLNRMTRDIRSAAAVDANSTSITIIPPADANGLQQIRYDYDRAAKVLRYQKTIYGTSYSYVACGEGGTLTSFSVATQSGPDWQGLTCIKNVRVTMALKLGPETFTVSASASPRRNQAF